MANLIIFFVEVHRICSVEPLDKSAYRFRAVLPYQKMYMVWHKAVSKYGNIVFFAVFVQFVQVSFIIFFRKKEVLFAVAAVKNVIKASLNEICLRCSG